MPALCPWDSTGAAWRLRQRITPINLLGRVDGAYLGYEGTVLAGGRVTPIAAFSLWAASDRYTIGPDRSCRWGYGANGGRRILSSARCCFSNVAPGRCYGPVYVTL